jgi:uncharacterized protein (TIGR02453 family)
MDNAFVLDFLRRLSANNNTAWMQANRADYLRARDNFADLVTEVLRQATPVAPELADLTPTQVMFRLHKNDRSQTDPEPYKRRFGSGLVPGGRHAERAGYYLALSPGGHSWLRAGRFTPTPAELAAIRQEISYSSDEFHRRLADAELLKHFPNGLDMKAAQLTRPPRGYTSDDANLPWLKLKSFGVGRLFSDEEVLQPDFIGRVVRGIQAARPWVEFLNTALDVQ